MSNNQYDDTMNLIKNKNFYTLGINFFVPIVFLYALYVQFFGESGPGGGFQSGVIFAYGFIYKSIFIDKDKIGNINILPKISCIGVLLYFLVGFCPTLLGANFLDYSIFFKENISLSRHIGVFIIEIGVFLTVFSTILLIYMCYLYGFLNEY